MTSLILPDKTTKATFKTDVERWQPELAKLCSKGFTPDRIIAGALHAGIKNPAIFECDPKSIFLAFCKCARLRLDVGEGIDLVPLNQTIKTAQGPKKVPMLEAWVSYKGLKALAKRENIIRGMDEYCVYEGDAFDYARGLNERLEHKPTSAAKRGKLRGAYSIIWLPRGIKTFHYLPIEDIEKVRAKSRSWGPEQYAACPDWYAMKTVVRDYLSRQPQSGALGEAIQSDDTADDAEATAIVAPREISDEELDQQIAEREP